MTRSPEREQFLSDVLLTALASVSYWLDVWERDDGHLMGTEIEDDNGLSSTPITLDTVARGLDLLLDLDYPVRFSGYSTLAPIRAANRTNGKEGDYDAEVADVVLQLGLLGEVRYG